MRFWHVLGKLKKVGDFWNRVGNPAVALEGDEIISYFLTGSSRLLTIPLTFIKKYEWKVYDYVNCFTDLKLFLKDFVWVITTLIDNFFFFFKPCKHFY